MGYALCYGECYACGKLFYFNPVRVPSFRDGDGVKQPVCLDCITRMNAQRKERGLEEWTIPADAYTECDEAELG